MNQLSTYQRDYLFSILHAGLHEVSHTVHDYLDLETQFCEVQFEEVPTIQEVEDKDAVSVHILYKGSNVGEAVCNVLKKDLKKLADQLAEGEDIHNKYEFMIDVAKEFTNLVCNRLLNIIDEKFSLEHSSCVPIYREPRCPVLDDESEGPFGVFKTRLKVGGTNISCHFSLVIRPQGIAAISSQIPNHQTKVAAQ